jgi:hypothetical protein
MSQTKRLSVNLSLAIDEWYNAKAKSLGMNKSAYITSVLNQHYEKGIDMEKRVEMAVKRATGRN